MAGSEINGVTFTDDDVLNPEDAGCDGYHGFLMHDHGFVCAVVFEETIQEAIEKAAEEGHLDQFEVTEAELQDYDDEAQERLEYLGSPCRAYDLETLSSFQLPDFDVSICASLNAQLAKG